MNEELDDKKAREEKRVEQIAEAKSRGFSAIPCQACGSLNTVPAGTCFICMACNHAGGCG